LAKRGRPSVEIKWQEFEALCAIQATLREMAIVFNCSERTIERAVKKQYKANFVDIFAQKRQRGTISLRRTLWQTALNGSVPLLIFLAKQYLGMANQVLVRLPGQPTPDDQPDLSRLSDEELEQLQRLIESAHTGKRLPASVTATTVTATPISTPEKENPGAGGPAEPAPDRSGEVAPTPPPVRPTDQT
jgi:hypothetical protein